MHRFLLCLMIICCISGCQRASTQIEPVIMEPAHPKEIAREKRINIKFPETFSVSPFPALSPEECQTDWGKEYWLGCVFAGDFDLYRAITDFKRALCLLPPDQIARKLEIQYSIALAYYLGKKYVETIYIVESSELFTVDSSFPAFSDLLIILYDSYQKTGKLENAFHILSLIQQEDPTRSEKLSFLSLVQRGDIGSLCLEAENNPSRSYLKGIMHGYCTHAKSVKCAEIYNAILPGAGYWYVGQRQTAVTAFLINSLFLGAAIHFFHSGNDAAALIILSFEGGWYFGGIYGAGLAAKYYNERLYEDYVEKITKHEDYFPIMMLRYSF